jgi:stage V sporulation protein R
MPSVLEGYGGRLEELARSQGLDFFPVQFEEVPDTFMMEIAVYGLPVRMPHWSFGVRYIYQLVQHRMGHSRLFEVVFPGNPGRAYLARNNSVPENTLVIAHVLGHADFSKNNELFRRSQEQVSFRIVDRAAENARRIGVAIEEHGHQRVEQVLDAALALEAHIDAFHGLCRDPYPAYIENRKRPAAGEFRQRFHELPGEHVPVTGPEPRRRAALPPEPERDLLWFIATYAPEMEEWERDIFLAVREEAFYFYPVFACQVMNEGWASYWHARLLREADFIPQSEYVDAIKTHSDVVRPHAVGQQSSLSINPYHLGFCMWERIIETQGLEQALRIRTEDDDFSFVRNYLDEELAEELKLFRYSAARDGSVEVLESDINALRDAVLAPRYNFGAPAVFVERVQNDGSLALLHQHETDGRGLDLGRAERVLAYVHRVWRRPVSLQTTDGKGESRLLTVPATAAA